MLNPTKGFKKFIKKLRNHPKKALKKLSKHPKYALMTWQGKEKWIPGSTALHWAAHAGHLTLVKQLIELGADVNAGEADWWSRPLDWAADSAQWEVAAYLIEKGAELGGDKWSNCTSLHVVAQGGSSNGKRKPKRYAKTTEVLIQAGVDVNAVANYGGKPPAMTPLDDALKVENQAVVEVLIKYGGKGKRAR